MKRKMRMKFWKWLYLYAEKKIRKTHMEKYKTDIKCPKCKTWHAVSGIRYNHEVLVDTKQEFITKCGQCETVTEWLDLGLVMVPKEKICKKIQNT